MKREYRYNNCGIFKDFSIEIGKEDISITEFHGCSIEEFVDVPREIFKKINALLVRKELLEQIESIKDKLDEEELSIAELMIAKLNSDKTTAHDLGLIESQIDELYFDPTDNS
jgi:hypothetical protein